VNELLDPKKLNQDGRNIRECCVTEEHPNALPIAVLFDVTGSMGSVPGILQQQLPKLHDLLQRDGVVQDPQILFGAVGDAYSDRFPLQVGQFESDNRMDLTLEAIILEGGGGGGNHESYELAAYYLARHAELDVNQGGRKGYLFIIGDERVYKQVSRSQVREYIGDQLQADIDTKEILQELREKFEVFFLFVDIGGCYGPGDSLFHGGGRRYDDRACYWRDLLGQNAIELGDPKKVCDKIAETLTSMEGQTAATGDVSLPDPIGPGATRL
jgi:hypothetical protein